MVHIGRRILQRNILYWTETSMFFNSRISWVFKKSGQLSLCNRRIKNLFDQRYLYIYIYYFSERQNKNNTSQRARNHRDTVVWETCHIWTNYTLYSRQLRLHFKGKVVTTPSFSFVKNCQWCHLCPSESFSKGVKRY